jgi:hypothetical protein
MLCAWCPASFADVDGYDAWEARVNERLDDAIRAGELVPVNIQSDGAFGVRVAVSPDGLNERESTYALATSDPYLLVVRGGGICVSRIEQVGDPSGAALQVPISDGRYAVRVTMVAWDEEPGSKGPDGMPTTEALADFIIHVSPEAGETYRTNELTFDPPR